MILALSQHHQVMFNQQVLCKVLLVVEVDKVELMVQVEVVELLRLEEKVDQEVLS